MTLYEYDRGQQVKRLCGVDEAGRGPLAGPVVAAAVVLPLGDEIDGIDDSKKLTEKKREALYPIIVQKAVTWAVGVASVEEIDTMNILQATFLAMRRAVDALSVKPKVVLIDGNQNPDLGVHSRYVIHGDATSASIAAASILAKVTRDRMMVELDKAYPQYGFAKHKGYGTGAHAQAIAMYGYCEAHRQSFLKKLKEHNPSISRAHGIYGEKLAFGYLKKRGYQVLRRNYRSEYGEVDLIAVKDNILSFVEVKLRDKNCPYQAQEAVHLRKQERIVKTALAFLQMHPCEYTIRFDIIAIKILDDETVNIQMIEDAFRAQDSHALF